MMRKKPNQTQESTKVKLIQFGLLMLFAAYLALFLSQPSFFGFTDEDGSPLDRITDLLIMPSLIEGIFGFDMQPLGVLDRAPILILASLWIGIGTWIGWPLVGICLGSVSRIQHLAMAALAGLAVLSTVVLAIGMAGGLSSRIPLLGAVSLLVLVAEWTRRRVPLAPRKFEFPPDTLAPSSMGGMWARRLIPVFVGIIAACYVLGSMLPPWEFDVVEYHLQAPKEFYQQGKLDFVPHNVYSNMPLGAEMHSLAAMVLVGGEEGWWLGGLVGKTITGGFSLLAALLVGSFMADRYGRGCGWATGGLLLAAPGNMHVATAGLIDMTVGAYMAALAISLAHLWASHTATADSDHTGDLAHESGQGRAASLFLPSLFAGAAAACKYPGLVFAVLPAGIAVGLIALKTKQPKRWLAPVGWAGLALLITCAPWFIKNLAETQNPVYPLAYDWFGGDALSQAQADRWNEVHRPQSTAGSPAFSFGAAFASAKQLFVSSPFLNPSLVFFACCGLVSAVLTRERAVWLWWAVALAAWIIAVWWIATHRIDRFWLPALPLITLVAGFAIARLGDLAPTACCLFVLFGLLLGCLQALSGAGPKDNRFFVSLNALEQEVAGQTDVGFLSPRAWINARLGASSKLLCVGDAKAYHYRTPLLYATCFNSPPGKDWLQDKSPQEQTAALKQNGITHLAVDWSEIARYRSPGNYGFSDWPQTADIEGMIQAGVLTRLATPFDPASFDILQVQSD